MPLLFTILFSVAVTIGYAQARPDRTLIVNISDTLTGEPINSVKLTLTSMCHERRSGKIVTKDKTYTVNGSFDKTLDGRCEWILRVEKEGYISKEFTLSLGSTLWEEDTIYMRRKPTVKLQPVD
jgi:hypothetical protein